MFARKRRKAYAPDDAAPAGRLCDAPDCAEAGQYRAPRDRSLREFHWFCLDHVRAYNASWDFYKGMGPDEIEACLRDDTSWQRPTWPLGRVGSSGRFDPEILRDPLGVLGAEAPTPRRQPPESAVPPELRAALDLLGLKWPLDSVELRARYKDLAKQHHPDATGGDKQAEERLKDINRAYSLLRHRLAKQPATAG